MMFNQWLTGCSFQESLSCNYSFKDIKITQLTDYIINKFEFTLIDNDHQEQEFLCDYNLSLRVWF